MIYSLGDTSLFYSEKRSIFTTNITYLCVIHIEILSCIAESCTKTMYLNLFELFSFLILLL